MRDSVDADAQIAGPCTYCGEPDHWRPDCPNIAKFLAANEVEHQKIDAASRIAELEQQLREIQTTPIGTAIGLARKLESRVKSLVAERTRWKQRYASMKASLRAYVEENSKEYQRGRSDEVAAQATANRWRSAEEVVKLRDKITRLNQQLEHIRSILVDYDANRIELERQLAGAASANSISGHAKIRFAKEGIIHDRERDLATTDEAARLIERKTSSISGVE